ncbi:MAG: DNA-processing protein DprA [Gammaproteobacteria bacterium]
MEIGSLKHFLCLYHDNRVGVLLLSRLLEKYGSFTELVQCNAQTLGDDGLDRKQLAALFDGQCVEHSKHCAQQDMDWSNHENNHLLWFDAENYPLLLRQISAPPPILYINGSPAVLRNPGLAIVGSRSCSDYGRQIAYWFASELAERGLTIISGLALGIDTEAHRGALDQGADTVAVLGTGIDVCYPRSNAELAKSVAEQGALVSEFPRGMQPRPHQFPRRNRIISGLGTGTLIVEGNERSGSLITARLALEQNREVFAIPGPITSQRSRGCHRFIKQGATLVESPDEIITALRDSGIALTPRPGSSDRGIQDSHVNETLPAALQKILELVSHSGSLPDYLVNHSGISWPELQVALLQLEMTGHIQRREGRYFPGLCSLHRPRD